MLQYGSAFLAIGAFATISAFAMSSAAVSGSSEVNWMDASCSCKKVSTRSSCSFKKSLFTIVTPVTRWLPEASPWTLSHSFVRSMMMESFSFWARAAETNGCGRRPIAFGSSASTEATSDASDLNSRVTSFSPSPAAEST